MGGESGSGWVAPCSGLGRLIESAGDIGVIWGKGIRVGVPVCAVVPGELPLGFSLVHVPATCPWWRWTYLEPSLTVSL